MLYALFWFDDVHTKKNSEKTFDSLLRYCFEHPIVALGSGKENPPKRIQKRRTQRYESG